MADRTVKGLLFVVAAALVVNVATATIEPSAPQAATPQERPRKPLPPELNAFVLDEVLSRAKAIDRQTADTAYQIGALKNDIASLEADVRALNATVGKLRDCIKDIGSPLRIGCL